MTKTSDLRPFRPRPKAPKIEELVRLGDLVGYASEPEAVVRSVADRMAAEAITMRGDHNNVVENWMMI